MPAHFKIGDLVEFNYPAPHQQGTQAHDPRPQVWVLHNGYRGAGDAQELVHGLAYKLMTEREINFLKAIMNEEFAEKIGEQDPQIGIQLNRMVHLYDSLNIHSPRDFYVRFLKHFLVPRHYEIYRKYAVPKITNVKVLTRYEIFSGQQKPGVFSRFADKFKNMRGRRM